MSHYSYPLTSEERQRLINSIPEVDVIDAFKENIQPRKEGRSASALNNFLELNTSEKEQELKRGHVKFKEELECIDDLDDPLAVYVNYVDWIQHHYPQGHSKESNLLPTLKAALETFVDDVRYTGHPVYLKLCLEYAKWVEEPPTIYRFLMANKIGQSLSLFYEEYAGYLERKSKYDDAEEVFKLGLTKGAIPKDRLERNFQRFKDRIKERASNKKPTKQRHHHQEQTEQLKSAGRTMLGVKSSSESRSSQPSNVYNRTQSLYGSPTPSTSSSIGRNFSSTTTPTSSNDTFRVFKEPSSSDSTVLPSGTPRLLPVRSSLNQSENRSRSDSFSGLTIKQDAFTPPPVEKFSIFRDKDSSTPNSPAPTLLERGLSFTSDGSESSFHSIRKKPLSTDYSSIQKRKKAKENPVSKTMLDRFNKYQSHYIETEDSQGKLEIIAIFKRASNLSFEELRARQYQIVDRNSKNVLEKITTVNEECQEEEEEEMDNSNNKKSSTKSVTVSQEEIEVDDVFFSGTIHDEMDTQKMRESSPTQEMTAETRRAQESMISIFSLGDNNEEEDVTWTKEYQTFKPFSIKNVDENEHPN